MKTLVALCCVAAGCASQIALADGQSVFKQWCEPCHGRASYLAGTAGLTVKYKGKLPAALEDRKDLTPVVVKTFVRQGVLAMPPFRKTEISDADLDALAVYLTGKRRR
jgi:(+)-pinoresinol hydroxylase